MVAGALIGAGASVLGGLIGSNARKREAAMQKEFAQKGIRWRVNDAKKAGIHPLYALGANTHSYTPVNIGDPLAQGIANAGQDISRAIDAKRTGDERVEAYNKTIQDLNVQRMGLENELLRSQINKINQAGHPPPLPGGSTVIDGQGDTLRSGSLVFSPVPGSTPAQEWEDWLGEPGGWLGGAGNVDARLRADGWYMGKEAAEAVARGWKYIRPFLYGERGDREPWEPEDASP